jgi:hypothetical protein
MLLSADTRKEAAMSNDALTGRDRLLLSAGAVAMLGVLVALQCPALSVDESLRAALASAATLLANLCAAILLQDLLAPTLRRLSAGLRKLASA